MFRFFALFLKILGCREKTKDSKRKQKHLGCCLDQTDASGHRGEVIEAVLKGNSLSYLGIPARTRPDGHPYGSDGHPYGSVWVRRASVWFRMVPYGPIWSRMVPFGFIWFRMVPYGSVWFHMVPYGSVQFRMVPYGSVWFGTEMHYRLPWRKETQLSTQRDPFRQRPHSKRILISSYKQSLSPRKRTSFLDHNMFV